MDGSTVMSINCDFQYCKGLLFTSKPRCSKHLTFTFDVFVVAAGYHEEACVRKLSTASLSYIEGALTQSGTANVAPVCLRANASSHSLSHQSSSHPAWFNNNDVDHTAGGVASAAGDNVTSPVSTTSTKSPGKFFVFGGTRSARKQRQVNDCVTVVIRVTTCLENLENLEMSGNLKHVREMSGMLLTVREMSGKKSCHGKMSQNCSLLDEYLRSCGYLLASSYIYT